MPQQTGLCQCGCGRPTTIAKRNRPAQGHIKGEPLPLLPGHSRARPARREPSQPGHLVCARCDSEKPEDEFPLEAQRGRYPYCLRCKTAYMREHYAKNRDRLVAADHRRRARSRYGLSGEEYDALFADPRCGICLATQESLPRRLAIDHDHSTGAVRGLLCGPCNIALGGFRDSADLLRAALTYLES